MGLIKATAASIKSVLADQWIDFFYCDAIKEDTLAIKGFKRVSGGSSNTKGSSNYITSGSVIAVADGQCMMIVEQGKVIEVCDEPGEYIFDSDRTQGIFTNVPDDAIGLLVEKVKDRFIHGGQTHIDQRVYYFNTKEITGNRYGTPSAIPFRVIDNNVGIDIDVSLRCFGNFSYRITDPLLFYKNVSGNFEYEYKRDRLDEQLEAEVISVLQPCFAQISAQGIRYSSLPLHTEEICKIMNKLLSDKWANLRGVEIVSFAIKGLKAKEEDEKMLKELQRNATFRDPTMAAAQLVGAQSDAMRAAASNTNAGAAAAFIGMNMASNATGMNVGNLFSMGSGQQHKVTQSDKSDPNSWTCSCGSVNTTRFCPSCGMKRPEKPKAAFCGECGYSLAEAESSAKFCPNCGAPLK